MSELIKTHFSLLPNELIINILENVDIVSVLTFCEVYDCNYFLKERNVVKTINLFRQYKLFSIVDMAKRISLEYVTTLNVNCIYWIPASKLQPFIKKLKNLEALYAIQTDISLTLTDLQIYGSLLKLKKLAVTLNVFCDVDYVILQNNVESVYLHAIDVKSISAHPISSFFPSLQQLWVEVQDSSGREFLIHSLGSLPRTKIFFQVSPPVSYMDLDHLGFATYYSSRRISQPYVVCAENFTHEDTLAKDANTVNSTLLAWQTLSDLGVRVPYGPKDARRLFLKQKTLDNICFEELNFSHGKANCVARLRTAVAEILKSASARHLKRLSITMCLFLNNCHECDERQDSNSFTKKRRGVQKLIESHPVEEIFRNFLGLTHLESNVCNFIPHSTVVPGYTLISLFQNLESLTLQIPVTVDGSFLIEVLKKCKNLQRLKITSLRQNEKLNYNFCTAIPNATALKDLRYVTHRIQMDKLLEQLCLMKCRTLERIVVDCKETDKFSQRPLENFLDQNPQLVFIYFLLPGCTGVAVNNVQRTLNNYKTHPAKVFLARKSKDFYTPASQIPPVHYYEMLKTKHDISTLRPLEDFDTF